MEINSVFNVGLFQIVFKHNSKHNLIDLNSFVSIQIDWSKIEWDQLWFAQNCGQNRVLSTALCVLMNAKNVQHNHAVFSFNCGSFNLNVHAAGKKFSDYFYGNWNIIWF